jgi:hypothetical protein
MSEHPPLVGGEPHPVLADKRIPLNGFGYV